MHLSDTLCINHDIFTEQTQYVTFSYNIHSQWKIHKLLKNEKPEPLKTLYSIFVYYPDGDMVSSKHM